MASGGGTVILNNVNTYTGGTILAGGTLQVGNNAALGTGTLTLAGGTLNTNIARRPAATPSFCPIARPRSTASSQGNNLTFAGPVSLVGSNTLAVSNTGLTAFTGVVSGSGGAGR